MRRYAWDGTESKGWKRIRKGLLEVAVVMALISGAYMIGYQVAKTLAAEERGETITLVQATAWCVGIVADMEVHAGHKTMAQAQQDFPIILRNCTNGLRGYLTYLETRDTDDWRSVKDGREVREHTTGRLF